MKLKMVEVLEATGGKLLRKEKEIFWGVSIDSRTLQGGELFIALKGKNFDGHDFVKSAFQAGAFGSLVNRTLDLLKGTLIQVKDTKEALGSLARYMRKKRGFKVIAVTGTSGKTTLKDMLYQYLSLHTPSGASPGNFNNLVGLPLSLLNLPDNCENAVLELGISLPGEMERLGWMALPEVSIFSSLGPAHLEGLESIEKIWEEKKKLLGFTSEGCIYNQDLIPPRLIRDFSGWKKGFGLKEGEVRPLWISFDFLYRAQLRVEEGEVSFRSPGKSVVYAFLATLALARCWGLPVNTLLKWVKEFELPPHRLNIKKAGGIVVLDDTYNSNPLSLKEFIEVMDRMKVNGKKIAVVGDMKELGYKSEHYHREAGKKLASSSIEVVVTFGEEARFLWEEVRKSKRSWHFEDKRRLMDKLLSLLEEGDLVGIKGSRAMEMEEIVEDVLSFPLPA